MSIINNIRDAFTRVVEAGTGAGYLIRDALFGAPETEPRDPIPYTPPFQGGQSQGINYIVRYRGFLDNGATLNLEAQGNFVGAVSLRRISEPTPFPYTLERWFIKGGNGFEQNVYNANSNTDPTFVIYDIDRADGQNDDGGDPPNPVPPSPISDSGLPVSPPPNIAGDGITVSEGLAPLPAAGALAAALAALRSALELAALADALADALKALKDALDNKDDKDDKKTVKIIQLDLGLIQRDGFLRLYPSSDSQKYQALYLDLQIREIPRGLGRFLGQRSPNYFRFTELGYISWVSPTFGVISTDPIRFSRVSLGCPDGAIGFFYHLGLNGVIKANATAFYEQEVEDESE